MYSQSVIAQQLTKIFPPNSFTHTHKNKMCKVLNTTKYSPKVCMFLKCYSFRTWSGVVGGSVQFNPLVVSDSLRPHESQHARPPWPSPTPGVHLNSRPASQWCHLAICHPLLSPSPPAPNPSQHQSLFQWVNFSHEVTKVLEFKLQHQSFQWTPRTDLLQNGLVGSPCSPRDSQESSPTPQFKSINSSALSFLHSPTPTSIHDHWKNHSLD